MKNKFLVLMAMFLVFILGLPVSAWAGQKVLIAVYEDNYDYRLAKEAFCENLKIQAQAAGLELEFVDMTKPLLSKAEFISALRQYEPQVDLIFTTGTPNAMAIKEAGITKPVLFSAVANPKRAGLVKSYHSPESNFTGCYCAVSADSQVRLLRRAIPQLKTIGIIYNPRDPAALYQADQWRKKISYSAGLEIKEFFVPENLSSEEELADFVRKISDKLDVLVTFSESKLSRYGAGAIKAGLERKIPVYASLGHLVEEGALLSMSFNFREAAIRVNVPQAIAILQGTAPEKIPVGTLPVYDVLVNLKTAKALGLEIPEFVLNLADKIIE